MVKKMEYKAPPYPLKGLVSDGANTAYIGNEIGRVLVDGDYLRSKGIKVPEGNFTICFGGIHSGWGYLCKTAVTEEEKRIAIRPIICTDWIDEKGDFQFKEYLGE